MRRRTFHRGRKCLEIVDDSFKIAGTFGKLGLPIIAACLIVENANNEISIDTFAAACSILEGPFCLGQIDQGFKMFLSLDVLDGIDVETDDSLYILF